MNNQIFIILTIFALSLSAHGQTLTEKLLREAPRLSINLSMDFESNLQKDTTYQSRQGSSLTLAPRYRLDDTYTLVARSSFTQGLSQENRSDMLNASLGITRNPIALGKVADLRPTLSLILPTNSVQRGKDSFRGALQLTGSAFFRTHSNWILGLGHRARLNNHQNTTSAINGANIQTIMTPFTTIGYGIGKFQLIAQGTYSMAWTYRGTNKNFFGLDQSVTYIPNRRTSFYVGHSNRGSILSGDGLSSNVRLFNSRSSVIYLGALYNY